MYVSAIIRFYNKSGFFKELFKANLSLRIF